MKTKKINGGLVCGVCRRRYQEKRRGEVFVLGACFTPHEQESDGECFGGGGVA